jgi:hypothetical protein
VTTSTTFELFLHCLTCEQLNFFSGPGRGGAGGAACAAAAGRAAGRRCGTAAAGWRVQAYRQMKSHMISQNCEFLCDITINLLQ